MSADFTINTKAITITADSKSKVYGDVDPALTYSLSTVLVSGDTISGALSRVVGENVGDYEINQGAVNVSCPNNYNITYVPADFTINAKSITIKADVLNKVYGGVDPALTYSLSTPLVIGDTISGALSRVVGEDVGDYTINQGTLDNSNYDITFISDDLSINPKALTVTADNLYKTSGNADPVFTYSITNGELETGDSITGVLSREAGEEIGEYAITLGTLTAGDNYSITLASGSFTINSVTLNAIIGINGIDGEVIESNIITATVDNDVDSLDLNFIVEENVDWAIYSDAECTNLINGTTISNLAEGENTYYIVVTPENGEQATYSLTITRAEKSNGWIIVLIISIILAIGGVATYFMFRFKIKKAK
ncbi:MAG: MBG domain-containing protein [Clostridia bacterium]|nr:MBG domain-containing protein [Clostridia bacterium]